MSIFSVAGTRLFIGSVLNAHPADFVASEFTAQSWVAISWVENLGQVGDESSEIAFSVIENPRTQKLKGVRNAGNMALIVGQDYQDDGQSLMIAAERQPYSYAFKLLFNDKPSPGTSGSIRYFIAQVMSAREQFDTVNNVIKVAFTLGVNSNIVHINGF
jgi:hypothetical protein